MLDMLSTHWHQIMFIGFLIVWATRSREQISELQKDVCTLRKELDKNIEWTQNQQAIDKVIVEAAKGISEDETRTAAKQLLADLTPLQTKPTEQAWFISRYLIHDYGVEALFDLQRMTDSISSKYMTEYAKEIFGDNSYKLKNLLRPQS